MKKWTLYFAMCLSVFIMNTSCKNDSGPAAGVKYDTVRGIRADTAYPVCAFIKPDSSGIGIDVLGRLIRHIDMVLKKGDKIISVESKKDSMYFAYGEIPLPGVDSMGRKNVQRGFVFYIPTPNVVDTDVYRDSVLKKYQPYIKTVVPQTVLGAKK